MATLGQAASNVALPVANGGTGSTTFTTDSFINYNGTSMLGDTKLYLSNTRSSVTVANANVVTGTPNTTTDLYKFWTASPSYTPQIIGGTGGWQYPFHLHVNTGTTASSYPVNRFIIGHTYGASTYVSSAIDLGAQAGAGTIGLLAGVNGTASPNLKIYCTATNVYQYGQIQTGPSGTGSERNSMLNSNFGYSTAYRVLVLGSAGTTYSSDAITISMGVDPSANTGASFQGDGREIMFRNNTIFIQPNAGNTNWLQTVNLYNGDTYLLSGKLYLGPGTAGDAYIYVSNGDANKPALKFNDSTNKWQYSNDGTAFTDIGTGGGGGTGYETIWVGAGGATPSATAGATIGTYEAATNDINFDYADFIDGSTTSIEFNMPMDEAWDRSTIKAKFYWTTLNAPSSGTDVVWQIAAGALSDSDPIDAALGTAVTVTDSYLAANLDMHISAATAAVTVGGTPALGDFITFKVSRVGASGSDTMVGTASLLGVFIQYQKTNTPAAW